MNIVIYDKSQGSVTTFEVWWDFLNY